VPKEPLGLMGSSSNLNNSMSSSMTAEPASTDFDTIIIGAGTGRLAAGIRLPVVVPGHHPMGSPTVSAVLMGKRANDRKSVHPRRELLKSSPECDTGKCRRDTSRHAAVFAGSVWLGVKGLDV